MLLLVIPAGLATLLAVYGDRLPARSQTLPACLLALGGLFLAGMYMLLYEGWLSTDKSGGQLRLRYGPVPFLREARIPTGGLRVRLAVNATGIGGMEKGMVFLELSREDETDGRVRIAKSGKPAGLMPAFEALKRLLGGRGAKEKPEWMGAAICGVTGVLFTLAGWAGL